MKISAADQIRYYLKLSKLKIMIPVSLTGFTGYFVFEPHLSLKLLLVTAGIFSLAVAASVLNQLQEASLDGKMNRTRNRPIPAQNIKINAVLFFLLFTFLAGIILIYLGGNLRAVIIGLTTLFWYNVIYTYSKRLSRFAVVVGAVTGALPPVIGWVAAGGRINDLPVILLGFLMFMGQVPHFWLLILKYGEEYEDAGLPSLIEVLAPAQIGRLVFLWVVFTVVSALFLCFFKIIQTGIVIIMLLVFSLFLIWKFTGLLRIREIIPDSKKYLMFLNLYILLVLLLLISDRIIQQNSF
jgi:protoheme IX farnesyltransferase